MEKRTADLLGGRVFEGVSDLHRDMSQILSVALESLCLLAINLSGRVSNITFDAIASVQSSFLHIFEMAVNLLVTLVEECSIGRAFGAFKDIP